VHNFLGDPPIDAQFALDLIFKTLIDDKEHLDYLTTMPGSIEQSNSLTLDIICGNIAVHIESEKRRS